jgi:MFS family permease
VIATTPSPTPRRRLPGPLRALGHTAFRRFYVGQGVSVIGSWVQSLAMSWLVYRLTGSTALLGLTAFLTQAPILLLGSWAGALSDRVDRRRLLLGCQLALAVQALLLGALVLAGLASAPLLLAMALAQGLCAGIETPARQAFLSVMVPDARDLPNAIALNSFLMNSGRFVGPTVAGLLIPWVGEGPCFLINAASFAAVFVAVRKMPASIAARASQTATGRSTRDRDASPAVETTWALLRRFAPARTLLPAVVLVSFCVSPYSSLMPAVAHQVFDGGPGTLGLLVGAAGLGGLAGTLFLATRRDLARLPRVTAFACLLAGAALGGFTLSRWLPLSVALMAAVGFGVIVTAASTNMLLQTTADPAWRGRIVGVYTTCFLGASPIGALIAGSVAARIGALNTMSGLATLCVLGALWVWPRAARLAATSEEPPPDDTRAPDTAVTALAAPAAATTLVVRAEHGSAAAP